MARRSVALTTEQVAERKRRWWGPERNARRRARYQNESDYREQAIRQVRDSYRRSRIEAGLPVRVDDCGENLSRLAVLGRLRPLSGRLGTIALTFTKQELATVLERNPQVIYRWLADELIPEPVVEAIEQGQRRRRQAVYLEAEVRAIVEVFGAHQAASQYYRAFHTETRRRLFAAVEAVRAAPPGAASAPAVGEIAT